MKALGLVYFSLLLVVSEAQAGSICGGDGDWRSGIIPDQWGPARFYKACRQHDDCYGRFGSSKQECDREFGENLRKECRATFPTADCFAAAEGYASAVESMGGDAFRSAQKRPQSNRNPTLHPGYYQLDVGTVVFSNGRDAFCSFVSEEHFSYHGSPWAEAQRNIIGRDRLASLSDHGACKINLKLGFFMIKGAPDVYWSNGDSAYCHVPSWSVIGSPVLTHNWDVRTVSKLAYHGGCRYAIDQGFFAINGQPEVYYSNGKDAYCWIPKPHFVTGEVHNYDFNIHSHTMFRKDGACPGMQ
jgi:hypothetical protein